MKALTAGVLALITVVLVFVGFGVRANPGTAARPQAVGLVAANQPDADVRLQPVSGFVTANQGMAAMAQDAQQPVLVNCGPGTQTLVRPVWLNGQQVSQVECVATGGVAYPGVVQGQPVVQTVQGYGGPVYETQTVRPVREYREYRPTTRRASEPRRSWQKTALVIGGSSAAGAGVGGLIGGKKGALIGAAIGGGASTIYEATKRRR